MLLLLLLLLAAIYLVYTYIGECGYGNKSLGEVVIGRYNTLSLIKKETLKKHQNQLQEVCVCVCVCPSSKSHIHASACMLYMMSTYYI